MPRKNKDQTIVALPDADAVRHAADFFKPALPDADAIKRAADFLEPAWLVPTQRRYILANGRLDGEG